MVGHGRVAVLATDTPADRPPNTHSTDSEWTVLMLPLFPMFVIQMLVGAAVGLVLWRSHGRPLALGFVGAYTVITVPMYLFMGGAF